MTLDFKSIFADDVAAGLKLQSVRKHGKRRFYPGQKLQLYTRMRTKHCRLLADAVCTRVRPCEIRNPARVFVGGVMLSSDRLQDFARADGFKDAAEFISFFRFVHGLPFDGQVIEWRLV